MKILILIHESLVPPNKVESEEQWASAPWKTEYDVIDGLRKWNHKVLPLGVGSDLGVVRRALKEFKPKIVFNLLEEFAGEAVFDQHVVSYLEMLGIKYTGCNPRGLMIARDKALSKKILKFHRIQTPDFQVFRRRRKVRVPKNLAYPMFVKTLNEEASLGITQESVVRSADELQERVQYFHDKYDVDVIAETFIEGREFYVGVMGNERLSVLPVWELYFDKVSDRNPRVATSKVKWDLKYRERYGIDTGPARNLDPELEKRIKNICRRTFKALELNGYARMDLRVTDEGKVYIIEANPNPDIGLGEEFADSAWKAGISYNSLLQRMINLGLKWDFSR